MKCDIVTWHGPGQLVCYIRQKNKRKGGRGGGAKTDIILYRRQEKQKIKF
jgi:hypothetical protein